MCAEYVVIQGRAHNRHVVSQRHVKSTAHYSRGYTSAAKHTAVVIINNNDKCIAMSDIKYCFKCVISYHI